MRAVRVPTVDDVLAAREIVARDLPPTPVIASEALGDGVILKLETMQPTGSFKVRGALSAIAKEPSEAVVTASAGNHGLGVAYAATRYGATATVVVPENASAAKRSALARFDITLLATGTSYDAAEAEALRLAAGGMRFISPYNDPDTIAGQGTIALELFAQVPSLATIVVPIGGGGLISGVALAASTRPGVRVIGVEAAASPAMIAALAGTSVIDVGPTLADGLAGNFEEGSVTVELCRELVDDIVTVTEEEIREGMRYVAREHGLVIEGAAAVGVAALQQGHVNTVGGATAVLLTGRNIALDVFAGVITS
jgi:threonine dehydratase